MLRVALHALPWGRLGAVTVLLGLLMTGVQRWPWNLWPLQGIAVGLLAAAAAWCLDEPVGAVVDAVPRPLWWRTVARVAGVVGVVGMWTVAVWWGRRSMFGHAADVWTQGLAASTIGVTWATWRRSAGVRAPGVSFASAVVPATAFLAVVRPFPGAVPVFPYADGHWAASTVGWIAAGAGAIACLGLVLLDARWWPAGSRDRARGRLQGPPYRRTGTRRAVSDAGAAAPRGARRAHRPRQ